VNDEGAERSRLVCRAELLARHFLILRAIAQFLRNKSIPAA
jgi:hypothetical protein